MKVRGFIRVLQALQPRLPEVVLTGGWASYVYRKYLTGDAVPGEFTLDVDIAVPRRLAAGTNLDKLLEDKGFELDMEGEELPPVGRHSWPSVDHPEAVVEFLTPSLGAGVEATLQVSGVIAQQLRFLELLLDEPLPVDLRERDRGEAFEGTIRVPRVGSFLLQKALTYGRRKPKAKRYKDLLYIFDLVEESRNLRARIAQDLAHDRERQAPWLLTAAASLERDCGSPENDAIGRILAQIPEELRPSKAVHLRDIPRSRRRPQSRLAPYQIVRRNTETPRSKGVRKSASAVSMTLFQLRETPVLRRGFGLSEFRRALSKMSPGPHGYGHCGDSTFPFRTLSRSERRVQSGFSSRVHHAAGFAKVMCSAVFITGLDPEFAAENVGYFTAPYEMRAKLGKPVVDREHKQVSVAVPGGVTRTAVYLGDQGCVTLPVGKDSVAFKPVRLATTLPDAAKQAWPMGDKLPKDPLPSGINVAKLRAAVDAAFDPPDAKTAAFVVTWKGRVIAERYAPGITAQTPLESWSMGKSVTGTLMGVLIQQGVYALWQPAPIPEWQDGNDLRSEIRIADLLHMSSGLRIKALEDPDYDPAGTYADHLYLYTGGVDAFHYAATRPLQWLPGMVGRYRNTDPVLTNYLIRLAVEKRGEEYLSFPRRALFDKLGMRTMVVETDPFGNFLTQGYDFASARDWARLGNFYLQDGVWNKERILPEGFVKFVSTLAPAWVADHRPIYGGFFWINGDGAYPVPRSAYFMSGAFGKKVMIIPSHDLVVVRLGHDKGAVEGNKSFKNALALLMEAVPGEK